MKVKMTLEERLDQILEALALGNPAINCPAMESLIEEGQEALDGEFDPPVRDAAIIAAASKAEHYEIATCGTRASYARLLGHADAEQLRHATLEEENNADRALTMLAESEVDLVASSAVAV